ncbi:type II secretion system protein [Planctomycetales bacterium ZRK34]|nr:type II secretion system protein [Planctomycetales bacterium ZRK34]
MRHRPGFTLVELIVVVSIIVALVAILIPSIRRSVQIAKETKCGVQVRMLTTASFTAATDLFGNIPNMGTIEINEVDGGEGRPYFVKPSKRDWFGESFGLHRESFYSPTNDTWNADEFWIDLYNGNVVIGYFGFAGRPKLNASIKNQVAPDTPNPVFALRLSDRPVVPWIWTDLNRQYPVGSFVTGKSSIRWGANHLYVDGDEVLGSHHAMLDGSVQWIEGHDLAHRFTYATVSYWY